jgi:hypothetical protein
MTGHCRDYLNTIGNKWVEFRTEKDLVQALPPGPYVYLNNALKPISRLFDDRQGTLLTALKPKLPP